MDPHLEDELAARADESRFRKLTIEATPAVIAHCRRFLVGETLSATPTLAERAGWTLSKMAPTRFHKHPEPPPAAPFDDDDAITGD